jgi:hypothetical protein
MKVRKTIRAKILELRKGKVGFLNESTKIFNVISTVTGLLRFTQPLNSKLIGF